ncbi:acyl-CoA dehydrogenase family protein [Dactylosporangium aurantiacum]|uniref:Acyl-[acyl-carrier-protein] dehydrogenase MbtN n=1 Tax=Dactylosporangium aurantiacum TaxID=35754 RepID=A0A9Q9MFF8_9ACTN|nr:acyl-CoA dehydrogenase family protein [Dactylosporangium aurantiacum]MDG6106366.1 acyl-CoA dehydrogenase family protein [Dactylosporangium aurantiacum]UWZ50591.1 acyl-CoA dehydrogenase family protein [Dactylosporangium aurantiacum]
MRRDIFTAEHDAFRDLVRTFIAKEVTPHHARWEAAGVVDRDVWLAAGRAGLLGFFVDEAHGGAGVRDLRYHAILTEELARAGATGPAFGLHNDIIGPYLTGLADDAQRERWLPGFCRGELITAIAMTEPGAGSDLQGLRTTAVRDGEHYVLNGQKTFISNGILADLVIVVARTDPSAGHRGFSLLAVERGMPGFERGRNLEKIGQKAQDTAELFFTDVRVPAANLLGEEGKGFQYLMRNLPLERLSIAVAAMAAAEAVFELTLEHCRSRTAFGQPIGRFQHNRFVLAELRTELQLGRVFVDRCLTEPRLSVEDAAMAKWWCTELQLRVVDRCLQLHGGYGYMLEYPVARAYLDARVQTIYGGTTEIMKEVVGRSLEL